VGEGKDLKTAKTVGKNEAKQMRGHAIADKEGGGITLQMTKLCQCGVGRREGGEPETKKGGYEKMKAQT